MHDAITWKQAFLRCACALMALFISIPGHAQSWTGLGSGAAGLNVFGQNNALCSDPSGNIYAAGACDTGGPFVAKWNGAAWQMLPSLYNSSCRCGVVTALCSDPSGNIYAAGNLQNAGGNNYVARWNGSAWAQVGSDSLTSGGFIYSMVCDSLGNVYAAGELANSSLGYYVVRWDGSAWSPVGTGAAALHANNEIYALCLNAAGNLYAGGMFTDGASPTAGNLYVARWDGAAWSEVGGGIPVAGLPTAGAIIAIAAGGHGDIYAGGSFPCSSSRTADVEGWNGSAWSPLDSAADSIGGYMLSLCFDNAGRLYAGGSIPDAGSSGALTYVKMWDGTSWSRVGGDFFFTQVSGTPGAQVGALMNGPSGDIYAAGNFVDTTVTDTTTGLSPNVSYAPVYVVRLTPAPAALPAIAGSPATAQVYPNPAAGCLYVALHTAITAQPNTYTLCNALGRQMMSGILQSGITNITISALPPGTYLLNLSGAVNGTYKVVKE